MSLPSQSGSPLTIFECPACGAVGDRTALDDHSCTVHPAPEPNAVRVFREEDVRPLWEAARDIADDTSEWKPCWRAVRAFPAPEDWET